MRLTVPFSAVRRWLRDIPVMWSLAAIRAYMVEARAEASLGMNAGDAAVMAVCAFAFIFVVAVTQVDASHDLGAQHDETALTPPARATGARQQESECMVKVSPGATDLVSRCRPWV